MKKTNLNVITSLHQRTGRHVKLHYRDTISHVQDMGSFSGKHPGFFNNKLQVKKKKKERERKIKGGDEKDLPNIAVFEDARRSHKPRIVGASRSWKGQGTDSPLELPE